MSWKDKIFKLNLPKRVYSEFVLEPVFVCGNRFVGKTRIIKELIEEEPEYCRASIINYNNFITSYGNNNLKIIEHMLKKRTSNMIYEHSVLCVIFNPIIDRYKSLLVRTDDKFYMDPKNMSNFINECRKVVSEIDIHQTVIVLLNIVGEFYRNFKNYLPYLYLQTLAYVSVIPELCEHQTIVKFLVAYDLTDLDDTLHEFRIYKTILSLVSPLNKRLEVISIIDDDISNNNDACNIDDSNNKSNTEAANSNTTRRYNLLLKKFQRKAKTVLFDHHKFDVSINDIL